MEATPRNMKNNQHLPNLVALDTDTWDTYSATPGDYWNHPDNEPLTNGEGTPLVLARRIPEHYEPLGV